MEEEQTISLSWRWCREGKVETKVRVVVLLKEVKWRSSSSSFCGVLCGVVHCGVVCCGLVWCAEVWCGGMWCDGMWCGGM